MSSKKTETYNLHIWEPGDDFLRAEFNENFTALDGILTEKTEAAVGAYTGDGEKERPIQLGFRPKVVALVSANGIFNTTAGIEGGLAVEGASTRGVVITDTGFTLMNGTGFYVNGPGAEYHYFALK